MLRFLVLFSVLLGCQKSEAPQENKLILPSLSEMKERDAMIMENLNEEPLREGTVEKTTEGRLVTEVWTGPGVHGDKDRRTETILLKDGVLVSQTLVDPSEGVTLSRQFQDGKVIRFSETRGKNTSHVFFKGEKITGRIFYENGTGACFLYEGDTPAKKDLALCEKIFNTAP